MSEYDTFIKKSYHSGAKLVSKYIPHINLPSLKITNIFIDEEKYMKLDEFLRNSYLTMEMLISYGYPRFSQIVCDMIWQDVVQKNLEPL